LYCPAEFDGWTCFNYTKAGSDAYVPCPALPIFNPKEKVHRYCEANGTWRINIETGVAWSNHTNCVNNMTDPVSKNIQKTRLFDLLRSLT
ncbi:calcitonin receptor, partial [Plakobranchus ocellatus]